MILNYTKEQDLYVAKRIAEVCQDELFDVTAVAEGRDKLPFFSQRPYVLVADYTMLTRVKSIYNMGSAVFGGSKIFYCIFIMPNGKTLPAAFAKNVAAVKNMVYFGSDAFYSCERENELGYAHASAIAASIRDCIPISESEPVCFNGEQRLKISK